MAQMPVLLQALDQHLGEAVRTGARMQAAQLGDDLTDIDVAAGGGRSVVDDSR
jgi:hypothetical protein